MDKKRQLSPNQIKHYTLLDVTDNLKTLQEFEKATSKFRLPPDVKPCILKILSSDKPLQTGANWKVPGIIACELRRVGNTPTRVQRKLERWGQARPNEVKSAVRYAFERGHEYGCLKLETLDICLYESRHNCPWNQQIARKGQTPHRERDLHRYGWQNVLRCSEQCIYFGIRELEKRRGWSSGSHLYVTNDEMGRVAGVCPKTARTGLAELSRKGLIVFKKGKQHKHYGIAGEICRIIPIPRPK